MKHIADSVGDSIFAIGSAGKQKANRFAPRVGHQQGSRIAPTRSIANVSRLGAVKTLENSPITLSNQPEREIQ
jgi:hypothetical protein